MANDSFSTDTSTNNAFTHVREALLEEAQGTMKHALAELVEDHLVAMAEVQNKMLEETRGIVTEAVANLSRLYAWDSMDEVQRSLAEVKVMLQDLDLYHRIDCHNNILQLSSVSPGLQRGRHPVLRRASAPDPRSPLDPKFSSFSTFSIIINAPDNSSDGSTPRPAQAEWDNKSDCNIVPRQLIERMSLEGKVQTLERPKRFRGLNRTMYEFHDYIELSWHERNGSKEYCDLFYIAEDSPCDVLFGKKLFSTHPDVLQPPLTVLPLTQTFGGKRRQSLASEGDRQRAHAEAQLQQQQELEQPSRPSSAHQEVPGVPEVEDMRIENTVQRPILLDEIGSVFEDPEEASPASALAIADLPSLPPSLSELTASEPPIPIAVVHEPTGAPTGRQDGAGQITNTTTSQGDATESSELPSQHSQADTNITVPSANESGSELAEPEARQGLRGWLKSRARSINHLHRHGRMSRPTRS